MLVSPIDHARWVIRGEEVGPERVLAIPLDACGSRYYVVQC
jgi:hypothetical protein